jgi:cation-transporting P-type ATPase C
VLFERLLYLRGLSRETLKIINQNYWMAISTDLFGLLLEALDCLSPLLGGLLHITHTLGIMNNSSRLLSWRIPQ